MAEYIDRSMVLMYINDIQLTVSDPTKLTILPRDLCEWIFDGITKMSTVEIVRCKDCKWYRDFDGCFFSTAECEPEHFCSWGERSE